MTGRLWIVGIVAIVVVACDQLTKMVIHRQLPLGSTPIELLPYVSIDHVSNTGAAFSIFAGARWVLVVAAVVIVLVIMLMAARHEHGDRMSMLAFGAIAGGAVGNVLDRVRLGAVTDFIDVGAWPTFNVADIFIVAGVGLVIVQSLRLRSSGDAP